MPLSSEIVGQEIAAVTHTADARWLMAYACALADYNPRYLHTHSHPVIAHPLFPVCLEWPVILNIRSLAGSQSLTATEAARGVHAAHDLHLFHPIVEGAVLHTSATMIAVEAIKPGASYTMRLDTRDDEGLLIARTYQLGIYRGVDVVGGNKTAEPAPAPLSWIDPVDTTQPFSIQIPVAAGLAHTYTECAKIWNPIHTDTKVALAAGLPDIILHGTATLALAVSQVVEEFAAGDPTRIKRIAGRFAAMVLMPSTITLEASLHDGIISYQMRNQQGELAISKGTIELT